MLAFHQNWVWVATAATGIVGLWGLILAGTRRAPGRLFAGARTAALGTVLVQVGAGFALYNDGFRPPALHMFYGFVILFTLAFAYIYRSQLAKRPALAYGLLLLFVMGLGLRAMANVG